MPREIPVVLVTPEQAQAWLDTRFDNERPIRRNKVTAFARDMEEENWHFTGDTIRFHDQTGKLLDGQHRLAAVKRSGKAQWFPVVNIPEEARAGIDTGSTRTLGDLLNIGNHVHGRELAAIVRRVLIYRNGLQSTSGGRFLPTHSEGVNFTNKFKDELLASLKIAQGAHNARLPMSPSALASAHFVCARLDQTSADEIFDRIITGYGLTKGDPVAAFRNRAIRHSTNNGIPMPADDVFRFGIITFNHVRKGVKIDRLQTPRGGWTSTNVPVPE